MTSFIIDVALILVTTVLLALIYEHFGTSLSNRITFAKNFIILGLTTMMIISIIKTSLALSLGLVGSLSIIRFRTAIKEPEELAYLFLVVALGVGFGAGQRYITLIFFLTIVIIIVFRGLIKSIFNKKSLQNMYVKLIFTKDPPTVSEITKVLETHIPQIEIERISQNTGNTEFLISGLIPNHKAIDQITSKINKEYKDPEINFLRNTF
jgi:hypothetical protein